MNRYNTHSQRKSDETLPTRAARPAEQFQPVSVHRPVQRPVQKMRQQPVLRRSCLSGGCLQNGCFGIAALFLLVMVGVLAYFLVPLRTNLLLLGIDRTPDGSAVGRSDTIILVSVIPLKPTVNMLSIPRDLWVNVPGVGENRINTAHFFAEAEQPGSGPAAAVVAVEQNFGVQVPYYARVRFDSFIRVIDALGGVTVNLPEDMSGYTAGQHHLNSEEALAFARDRKGADDFFRMSHGQLLVRAVINQLLAPSAWSHLPAVMSTVLDSVDTNVPFWLWPRLGLAVARAMLTDRMDSRTIEREMVTPYITSGGASVLLPNWDLINPVIQEMFAP